jgi:hypothetical protein
LRTGRGRDPQWSYPTEADQRPKENNQMCRKHRYVVWEEERNLGNSSEKASFNHPKSRPSRVNVGFSYLLPIPDLQLSSGLQ